MSRFRRTVPGWASVRGLADSETTVTVNGNAAFRVGEYYYGSTGLEHGLTIGRIRQIRVKIIKGIHALVIMEKLILQNPVG